MSRRLRSISLEKDTRELASTYEQLGVIQFEHGKQLIAPLRLQPGERVLDIGTGTGRLAEFAAGLVGPNGRLVGIDPLADRIAIARQRETAALKFDTGSAADLSRFAEDEFDVVYLNSVLHWIKDKGRVLGEIHRVLRRGGRVGLTIQDPTAPHQSRVLLRQAMAEAGIEVDASEPGASHGVTDHELRSLFDHAGFLDYHSELKTIVNVHSDAETLLRWSESSGFGNFLAGYSASERDRIAEAFGRLAEAHRTSEGLKLNRYLRYAFARKPC